MGLETMVRYFITGKAIQQVPYFKPDSYLSAGLFKSAGKEINKLVSKKRGSSLTGVIVSVIVGGITFFTLWQDDDFKDILVEARKQGENN